MGCKLTRLPGLKGSGQWHDMTVTSRVHQGHVTLNIFIHGLCQTEGTMGKDAGVARLQGGAGVGGRYSHHVLSFPTAQCLGMLLL